jgi:hypothetical protein
VQPLYRAFLEDSSAMQVPAPIVEKMAALCEVEKVTPEIVLETLEANARQLGELTGARHGGRFARNEPGNPRK